MAIWNAITNLCHAFLGNCGDSTLICREEIPCGREMSGFCDSDQIVEFRPSPGKTFHDGSKEVLDSFKDPEFGTLTGYTALIQIVQLLSEKQSQIKRSGGFLPRVLVEVFPRRPGSNWNIRDSTSQH
ncbi:hypothetical protein HPP92_018633 [Vanilla planifolia]|uniref:Uncharacterized protein n=1 Tax=Vanilla planifolia TaxID=51239 RepID=A0A835QET5_VANPL|nr:hypothetical protein HPP92_018633 [Vanilla planifolia]